MKILYISQFYEPESIAPSFRATEHSRFWAAAGAGVTVFTGWPNYPTGEIFDGYNVEMLGEEHVQGVRILRSKLVAKPNTSFVNRLQNGLSFLWYGLRNAKTNANVIGNDYDVVLATSGTVFAGYLGYRIARHMKKPLVIEYRDLTYAQLVATGSSETSMKCRGMKWLELMMARKATKVVVLTETFKETLSADGIDPDKIEVIPNGADVVDLDRSDRKGLTFGYFGAMGLSQVLPDTVRVIKNLQDIAPGLRYLLIGEGAARKSLEECVSQEGAGFAELIHGMPKDELEKYYSMLDMSVVSLRRVDAFRGTIPSKIFQSWARGIPVLFLGPDGEAADMIRSYGLGFVFSGTDEENAKEIRTIFSQPTIKTQLNAMGLKARSVMEQRYTRERLAESMLNLLGDVVVGDLKGKQEND